MDPVVNYEGQSQNGEEGEGRDRWTSRFAFVLGAIGSAVGLGNLWRFPAQAYANGGSAFLLPYAVAFFIFGVPLLFLELLLGRHFQGGDPVCFGGINPKLKGIGWASVLNSFLIASYYNVIVGVAVIFFINSFNPELPWAGRAGDFFSYDVLGQAPNQTFADQVSTNWQMPVALMFVWVVVFFSIWKGVGIVSKVVMVSVPLPIILMFVLLFATIGLEGASDGIYEYIGKFDPEALAKADIWTAAISQIFFSIGVCFGVMTAYSSYRDPNEGVLVDTFLISSFNSLVSVVAGFVVFSSLGVLAFNENKDFSDLSVGGPGVVFIAYPEALTYTAAPQVFSVIFFGVIFFLALDSAFSIVEACTTAFHDTDLGSRIKREYITLYTCVACFVVGVFYCLDNGFLVLDAIDYYVNSFGMVIIGLAECVAAAWFYKHETLETRVGRNAANGYVWGYWLPIVACCSCLVFIPGNYAFIGFAFLVFIPIFWTMAHSKCNTGMTMGEYLHTCTYNSTDVFVDMMMKVELKPNSGEFKRKFAKGFAAYWAVSIKFIIPTVLTFLLIAEIKKDLTQQYGGLPNGLLNAGRFVVVAGIGLMFLFWVLEEAINHNAILPESGEVSRISENPSFEDKKEDDEVEAGSMVMVAPAIDQDIKVELEA